MRTCAVISPFFLHRGGFGASRGNEWCSQRGSGLRSVAATAQLHPRGLRRDVHPRLEAERARDGAHWGAPVSLRHCRLRSSFHAYLSSEAPHAEAQRGEALPVQLFELHAEFFPRGPPKKTRALRPRRQEQVFQGLYEVHHCFHQMALEALDAEKPVFKSFVSFFLPLFSLFALQCDQPDCTLTFKKRRAFKLHLQEHEVVVKSKCSTEGCVAMFDSHVARKAHEKKHAGYRCPRANCQVLEHTWGKLKKHMAKHSATFTCQACKKVFKKAEALRRHKRIHASHKPVLVCPREDCHAYFSTTFNLQHHIRKVHLELLKYKCSFPDCPRMFAMRESLTRHLLRHDPSATTLKKRKRTKKTWQKRLDGHHLPRVEEDLRSLFALRMRISRRAKVEMNLAGLFNERKIPHYVDTEVNLRSLFGIKQPRFVEEPVVLSLEG
uniref:P43 5S RNA-binding protein n=1 Tax=Gasterosteus aculeatus aculeatus TaxID=481459 RepID=A0AAQ4RWV9_GASAC